MTQSPELTRRSLLAAGLGAGVSIGLGLPAFAAQREINIGINTGLPFLPYAVAEQLDLFNTTAKDLGVTDATFAIRRINVATALIDAILTQNVQFGTLGNQALLNTWAKTRGNVNFRGISAYWKGKFSVFSNTDRIKSFADIGPDDKIAVQGPKSAQALYVKLAAMHYFGPDQAHRFDNQLVLLPHTEAVTALTRSDAIQVYMGISPYSEFVAKSPRVHLLATSRDFADPATTNAFLGAIEPVYTAHPDVPAVIIETLNRANKIILEHPEQATKLYSAAEKTPLSFDELRAVIAASNDDYATVPNGLMKVANVMSELGDLKDVPASWKDFFTGPITQTEGS
ncbi:UNVERIFIED_ORG: NitT/TauT family transport system substrate-binding protein [Shinella zoogloeoides]|nr:NitT/TauT family transport system substrate-binding protein [Shinella zoogloeoides]